MISVDQVAKRFGALTALESCSLEIARGTITGLIGPNGAGKTTLFNIVAGFLSPSAGRVLLDGEDITRLAPHARFHRGLVRTFQIPHEFTRMTVLENLMLVPARQSGERLFTAWLAPGRVRADERRVRARAMEVLETLELTRLRHEPAGNLSGGQKKLLELGRVMMIEPRVILLDEPGAGVNRTLLAKLSEVIRRLNREHGYTLCIIEHDMDLIAELCDPVVVMAHGGIIAQGTMAEIRKDPAVLDAYFGGTVEAAG